MAEEQIIVIDTGSSFTKAGFAGEDVPRTVFPSLVGKQNKHQMLNLTNSIYVGKQARSSKKPTKIRPIERGFIVDWDAVERLCEHTFYNELRIIPEENPMLLSEIPSNSKEQREKTAQVMFETFSVPSLLFAKQAVLSLYASGKTSGIVLDSGDGSTHAVPIHDGFAISDAITRLDLAGQDITDCLMKLMMGKCSQFLTSTTIDTTELFREIKEKLCYVSVDSNSEIIEKEYELPDGSIVSIGKERFQCTEILFQPNLIGLEITGIHEAIFNSIGKCDIDKRRDLYNNIIISSGNMMFEGISERLTREITSLAPTIVNVNILAPPFRKYSVWIGGSIFAPLINADMWIRKEEYEDVGSGKVHRMSC